MADLNGSQFLGGVLGVDHDPPVGPWARGPRYDAEWSNTEVEKVPIRSLVATQNFLDPDKVEHYRRGGRPSGRKLDKTPRVAVENNMPYLIDGHHRVVAAALNGQRFIDARVHRDWDH